MKSPQMSSLSMEAVQEFGALLLLDHLMRYELLQVEKVELEDIIDQLENGVAELKKASFAQMSRSRNFLLKRKN